MPNVPIRLRHGLGLLTAVVLSATVAVATTAAPAEAAPDPRLVRKVNAVMSDSRVQRAKSSAVVLDAVTGERLYSRNGIVPRIPASNTKVLTAAAALETLGPGFTFHTDVYRRDPVVRGVLDGRLYLKGFGDPSSRENDYALLARQVRRAGITRVTGRLVVDPTYFDSVRYNPGWSKGYAQDYYAGEISALTVAPNADLDSGTVILKYRPGRAGQPAVVTTSPAAAAKYIKIANRTTTSGRGTSTTFSARRNHGSNTITVSGRVPIGRSAGSWQITVHRPELYAAAVFRAELAEVGVKVEGATLVGATPSGNRTRVARDRSRTLAQLLVPFMKLSNNMHAEHLTKTMSRVTGGSGTWKSGLAVTTRYLRRIGVPMAGVSLTDGSGLTRANRITGRAMAKLLFRAGKEPWFQTFYASFPVAGNRERMVGGTLRNRMNGTRAAYNARGKTGTLTGVTALSGYVTGADGRKYVFVMLSNYTRSTPRPVENTFVVTLAGHR
ncbi:MAG TPA: D-alanyl-D-alanine carboxypeptidase/D-alanyl-D-alanine-endopeptidase [Propionibacteriaceae bacterium]|jgi:D-alanyl-D-alanine carboxypeptidase/D-alanyl-D-alanine-endopeptidase (penicillin-binding protein 4)|nr:D-alanyl-D-alanine carboxypeptidase/D-alanyl-D-alanine-endopeptidase [Propionibacteriaceae bacterium]